MKKIFSYAICTFMCFMMLMPMYAAGTYVTDPAGVLPPAQLNSLETAACNTAEKLRYDVTVAYVESLNGQSAKRFADTYYDRNGYADNGILLLVAVSDREYWITTTGICEDGFTDTIIDALSSRITPYLAVDDWVQAGEAFIRAVSEYGGDLSIQQENRSSFPWSGKEIVLILVVSAVVAGGTVWSVVAGMKTAKCQRAANQYLQEGSCHITQKTDQYLYSTVTKTRKPENQNRSSGGGGRSHGGGGGKF